MEVPPRSMLEISAYLEATVDGVWLVDEQMPSSYCYLCTLVQPRSTTIPVRLPEDPSMLVHTRITNTDPIGVL